MTEDKLEAKPINDTHPNCPKLNDPKLDDHWIPCIWCNQLHLENAVIRFFRETETRLDELERRMRNHSHGYVEPPRY